MALPRLSLDAALARLRAGGVVVFPTEAGYVIGCRAADAVAAARVVAVKHRPEGRPLPVLVPSAEALRWLLESPLGVLADRLWPGPLTLVVPAFPGLSAPVTAGTNMVGVRASRHPIARALVEGLGEPVVATSANRSGEPAAFSPADCDEAGLDDVDGLVDDGTLPPGASTVVGFVDGDLVFFADGDVSEDDVRAAWEPSRVLD